MRYNSVIIVITAGRRSRFRFSSVHLYPAVSGRDGNRTHVRKYYLLSFFTLFWAVKVSLFHQSIPNCLWITSTRLFHEPQIFTRRRNIVLEAATRLPLQVFRLRLILSFGD